MSKVISYANVQIKYNADTSGLKAHRTDMAAMTRLIRAGESEGEKFVRRIEMITRVAAGGKKSQEELASATQAAINQFLQAATASGRYLEALDLIDTVAPNAAVNTKALADAFRAEQQAAKDAADALAAKKRLMADYAMDNVAAKREVKGRQQAEKDAADAQARNAKLDARLAEEKRQRMAQANALSKKLDSEDAASRQARLTGQQQMQQQADAYLQMLEEEAQKNREMLSMEELGIQLAKQRNAEERERVRLLRQQRKDREAFRQLESSQRMGHPQSVADFSEKLRKLISDTERQEEIARNKEQQAFHNQRMARSKEYEAEIIRAANSQTQARRKAQSEVNSIIEQGMTVEQRREKVLQRLDRMVNQRIISEKKYKQAVDAVNKSAGNSFKDLAMGAFGGATPLGGLTAGAIGAFGAQQGIQFIKDSVDAYAEMRGELVKLEVMLGSAESAERAYAQFRGIAVKASLESKAVTGAALTLAQFGVQTDKLAPTMEKLSVIAAGNSERLQSLALAYAQVTAAGRLTGQETLQFVNAGFSPLAEISRVTGVNMSVLRKRMEEGKISVEDVSNALITATESGGRFYGMADKLSKDLPGQIAALKDEFLKLKQATGELFVDTGGGFLLEGVREMFAMNRKTLEFIGKTKDDIIQFGIYGDLSANNAFEYLVKTNIELYESIVKTNEKAGDSAKKAMDAQRALALSQGAMGKPLFEGVSSAMKAGSTGLADALKSLSDKKSGLPWFSEMIKKGADGVKEYKDKRRKEIDAIEKSIMSKEQLTAAEAKRLALMVRQGEISLDTAAKVLAKQFGEETTFKTDLPAAVSAGTKEAYELINRAESDIRSRQLQAQKEQLTEQKATNTLLREINGKPIIGVMK